MKKAKTSPAPEPVTAAAPPSWHTEGGEPLPLPEQIQPPSLAQRKYVHAPVLLLNGTFASWKFNILSSEIIARSADALFSAFPSAVKAWFGSSILVNDNPVADSGLPPPFGPNLPTPPERPRPPELPPLP